jgi:hypothetical protein
MSYQLAQFRQDGDRASDDDQRTVVLSLSARPRNEGHCDECLVPANLYSKALAKLLACLRPLTPTKSLTDEIARTIEFEEIPARDISHGYQP